MEVLVFDDGSTDETARILRSLSNDLPALRVEILPRNLGKGAAVRRGVLVSAGRRVLFADADQSTPIREWRGLSAVLDRGADVAIGSREIEGARRVLDQPLHRRVMGDAFVLLRRIVVLRDLIDTQCGFKLFRRQAAQEIFSRARIDRFCFDVEVLVIARNLGLRVVEVPVHWHDDPRSRVSLLGDPLDMFLDLFRIRRSLDAGRYD